MTESKWCCTYCTYQNWPAAAACAICRNARTAAVAVGTSAKIKTENDIYKLAIDDREDVRATPPAETCDSGATQDCSSEYSEADGRKWSCAACTYLNWPKSLNCVQCHTPNPIVSQPPATDKTPTNPDIDEQFDNGLSKQNEEKVIGASGDQQPNGKQDSSEAREDEGEKTVREGENALKSSETEGESIGKVTRESTDTRTETRDAAPAAPTKWSCRVCTFENCVRNARCVICGSARLLKPSATQPAHAAIECDTPSGSIPHGSTTSSSANSRAQSPTSAQTQPAAKKGEERDSCEKERQSALAKACDSEPQRAEPQSQAQRGSVTRTRQARRSGDSGAASRLRTHAPTGSASWSGVSALTKANGPRAAASMRRLPCTAVGASEYLDELNRLLLACVGVRNTVSINIVRQPRGGASRGRAAAGPSAQGGGVGSGGGSGGSELPFPCYFVGLECSFTLPPAVYAMPFTLQSELLSAVVDGEALAALEADAAVNWSLELVDRLQSRLYALANRTSGDCLLDSSLQATCGACDRDAILRRLLCQSLVSCSELFFAAWKRYELERQRRAGLLYTLSDAQWRADWRELLELAAKPGASLEQLHVFALAHVLRRPIIVYSVRFVTGLRGDALAASPFQGVYLPIFWERAFCSRSPIALGYTRGHFSALVAIEPSVVCPTPSSREEPHPLAAAPSSAATCVYYPLVDCDGDLLPIHFATPSMMANSICEPNASELDDGSATSGVSAHADLATLCEWLDCVETPSGLLVARCRLQPRPAPVHDLCQNWLDSFCRPTDSRVVPIDVAGGTCDSAPRTRRTSRCGVATPNPTLKDATGSLPRRKPSPVEEHSDACAIRGRLDEDIE